MGYARTCGRISQGSVRGDMRADVRGEERGHMSICMGELVRRLWYYDDEVPSDESQVIGVSIW